jgi:integrase
MAKYLVVGIQSYDFKDEKGKSIKGNNVFFLDESKDEGFKGYKTGKLPVNDSFMKTFTSFPGYYDIKFSVKVGSAGKLTAILETGLRQVRFYDFRHGHATYLLEIGEDIKVISDRLGHSTIMLTGDTYTHVQQSIQQKVASKLNDTLNI